VATLAVDEDGDRVVAFVLQRQHARGDALGQLLVDAAIDEDGARLEQAILDLLRALLRRHRLGVLVERGDSAVVDGHA
jgi:triphosphoribosyl-dephospho-CoA synthetase